MKSYYPAVNFTVIKPIDNGDIDNAMVSSIALHCLQTLQKEMSSLPWGSLIERIAIVEQFSKLQHENCCVLFETPDVKVYYEKGEVMLRLSLHDTLLRQCYYHSCINIDKLKEVIISIRKSYTITAHYFSFSGFIEEAGDVYINFIRDTIPEE